MRKSSLRFREAYLVKTCSCSLYKGPFHLVLPEASLPAASHLSSLMSFSGVASYPHSLNTVFILWCFEVDGSAC